MTMSGTSASCWPCALIALCHLERDHWSQILAIWKLFPRTASGFPVSVSSLMGLPTAMGAQTWLWAMSSLSESLSPLRSVELFAYLFVCFSVLSQGLCETQTQSPECWDYSSILSLPRKSPCSTCWLLFFLIYTLQVRSDLGKYKISSYR